MDYLSIFLDKEYTEPIYYQLYIKLAWQINSGHLAANTKLPSKRKAANQLGVSVNTVDTAYQMLAAEGYVQAQARSGFVVNKLEQVLALPKKDETTVPKYVKKETNWQWSFSTGDLDGSLFPKKTWSRIFKEILAEENNLFDKGESIGDEVLRSAIAEYVRSYRGVNCAREQVIVGAGLEILTAQISRILGVSLFALENPGYPKAAHILQNNGYKIVYVAVDADGMRPDLLEKSGAQAAYLTPSHQYPTGGVMRLARRTELLQWAAAGQRYIIEDDYDSEFRFDGRPLPCMQGLDKAGQVVYAGTFSRSLAHGLRAAYLVLPPHLLAKWHRVYGDYACTVSRPEQHTLAHLINQGHFARSINRVRCIYRKRRDILLQELAAQLKGVTWEAENTHTGLYFIFRLYGKDATKISVFAREHKLCLYSLNEHEQPSFENSNSLNRDALLLGYAGISEAEIPLAVSALALIIRKF